MVTKRTTSASRARKPANAKTDSVTPKTVPSKSAISFAQLQRDAKQLGWEVKKTTKGIVAIKEDDDVSKVSFVDLSDFEAWLDKEIDKGTTDDSGNSNVATVATSASIQNQDEEEDPDSVNLLNRKTDSFFLSAIAPTPQVQKMLVDLHDMCEYESLDAWTRVQVCKAFNLSQDMNDVDLTEALSRFGLTVKVYDHPDLTLAYNVYSPM